MFGPDSSTSAPTFLEFQQNISGGLQGLDFAISVTVNPDGMYLYAAGGLSDAVAVFSLDSTAGGSPAGEPWPDTYLARAPVTRITSGPSAKAEGPLLFVVEIGEGRIIP